MIQYFCDKSATTKALSIISGCIDLPSTFETNKEVFEKGTFIKFSSVNLKFSLLMD